MRIKPQVTPLIYMLKGDFRDARSWGGSKPESVDVEAEQVPDAPVLTLLQSNGKISPTFNLIQLDYENLQRSLGGSLIESGTGQDKKITGWNAPSSLVELSGEWEIEFVSGQTMSSLTDMSGRFLSARTYRGAA